jgi:hypothetical protein
MNDTGGLEIDLIKFKATRYKFYRLGQQSDIKILQTMGMLKGEVPPDIKIPQDAMRDLLFQIAAQGRLEELNRLIEAETQRKAELLKAKETEAT